VQTLEDHSAFFASEAHRGELTFLLENGRRQRLEGLPNRSTGSFRDDLAFCLDALARAHCAVVFADLTTPDVRQFGLHVVRTLATGLQPIHFGHGAARLGGRRLYDVPARLGHGAGPRREQDLNPCPHPLA
jgi:ribosomal protein S12 methylthiotransferase accessory factor